MKFKNILCAIVVVVVICIWSCLVYAANEAAKSGEPIQWVFGITTVFDEAYTFNKSNEEVKEELFDAYTIYNFSLYDNKEVKMENLKSKEVTSYMVSDNECKIFKQLGDKRFIAEKLNEFNVSENDIDTIIYMDATEDIWAERLIMGNEIHAQELYEAFVFTDKGVYVLYLPIAITLDYDVGRIAWSHICDASYEETYDQWVEDRILKKDCTMFIDDKIYEETYRNKYYQFIPMRKVLEYVGATVEWNDDSRTIDISYGETKLKCYVNASKNIKCGMSIQNVSEPLYGWYSLFDDTCINIDGRLYLIRPKGVAGDFLYWLNMLAYLDNKNNIIRISTQYNWDGKIQMEDDGYVTVMKWHK